jgi:hypothetical protein
MENVLIEPLEEPEELAFAMPLGISKQKREGQRPTSLQAGTPEKNGSEDRFSKAAAAYKNQALEFSNMRGDRGKQLQEVATFIQACYDAQVLEFRSILGSRQKQLAEVARCLAAYDTGLGRLKHLLL